MKHRRPFATPQQLIPRKEKDMLKIINDPEAFKRVMELQKAAIDAQTKVAQMHAVSWRDWSARAFLMVPEKFKDDIALKTQIEEFANVLKGLYDDTPDELKTCNE